MISADHLITDSQFNAVLARLLEATVKGSILLLISGSAASLLRNRSAALRHMIWVTATAAAVSVLLLPTVMPAWRVLPAFVKAVGVTTASNETAASSSPSPSLASASMSEPRVSASRETARSASSSREEKAVASNSASTSISTSASKANSAEAVAVRVNSGAPVQSKSTAVAPISWSLIALSMWIAGFVFWLGYYCLGGFKVRRLMRNASPVLGTDWVNRVESVRQQLRIRRPVNLLCSNETEVPLTFGVIYPKIVLPADADEWTGQRKQAVIQHEMAHIARLDAFTQLVSHLACAVYWFNPLVWVAAQRVRFERERACDDYVLAAGSAASEYANDLLAMVSSFRKSEHYAVALAMARRSQLEGRLVALLNPKLSRQAISRGTAMWVAAIAAVFVLPLAALSPADPAQKSAPATAAQPAIAPSGVTGPNPSASGTPAVAPAFTSGEAEGVRPALAPVASDSVTQGDEARPALAPAAETGLLPGGPEAGVPGGVRGGVSGGVGTGIGSGVGGGVGGGIGTGVQGDYAVSISAPMAVASAAVSRQKIVAATPPPERQTGFECTRGRGSSHENMHSNNGQMQSWQVSWSGDGCGLSLDSQGEVTFNNDFTDFQSISNGGYVDITSRMHGDVYRLNVRPGSDGRLQYTWSVNNANREFGPEGRKWLANFLIAMDRQSASGVKQRFPKLMQEGGAKRVLEEVSYMDSDYARATYLLKLVQDVQLKPEELKLTLARTSEMGSDYECARVLMAVAGKYPLQDPSQRAAFLAAIDTIQSDYEHARVLMAFFQKGPIPVELSKTVLDSASRIKSDYEHARVLMAFFEHGTIPMEMARNVLQSASNIKSDYEHARVLVEMANRKLVDASTQSDFLASVNAIKSDYEHARALVAFLGARQSDDAAVLGVIQSVPSLKSDYEAARVLGVVANGKRLEGNLRDAYIHAAQGIHSEHDRTQALAAVGYKQASL